MPAGMMRMMLPQVSKMTKNLALYLGINAASFLTAGLKLSLFGDGTITWAQWRFNLAMLLIGFAGSQFMVIKSFFDETQSEEKSQS
jgi:hypothetical protein